MPDMYMVRSKKSGKFLRKNAYSGYHLSKIEGGGTMFTKLSHIKLAKFIGFPIADLEIVKFKIVPDTIIQMSDINK